MLIGYNLDVVLGCSKSEGQCIPVAYLDLIHIYLYAAVYTILGFYNAGSEPTWLCRIELVLAALTLSGILILLDLQVVDSCGLGGPHEDASISQGFVVANLQGVNVGVLTRRELYGRFFGLKYSRRQNVLAIAPCQSRDGQHGYCQYQCNSYVLNNLTPYIR